MTTNRNAVWFITGANRGIGLALALALLGRPRTTVVGTVRTPSARAALTAATSSATLGASSALILLELDFAAAPDPATVRAAFDAATAGRDVAAVDALVLNAGTATGFPPILETTADELRRCFEVNAIAPLAVAQALWPLLEASGAGKVVAVSSSVGSIGGIEGAPGGAYGASKAALNWLVRSLYKEQKAPVEGEGAGRKKVWVAAVHPGWVKTEMGEWAAREWGYEGELPNKMDECVEGMLKLTDAAEEKYAGTFVTFGGQNLPW